MELVQPHLIDAGMRLVGEDITELHHSVSAHINAVVPVANTAHAEVITQAVEVPLSRRGVVRRDAKVHRDPYTEFERR